jgi:hypothetical protein
VPMPGSHKIPAPFRRPSIEVQSGKQDMRVWRKIPAQDVEVGDTVAYVGTVIRRLDNVAQHVVTLVNAQSHDHDFRPVDLVNSFIPASRARKYPVVS